MNLGRWLVYGFRDMVIVRRMGRWLLYGDRGDGCCMERGEMVVVWREGR